MRSHASQGPSYLCADSAVKTRTRGEIYQWKLQSLPCASRRLTKKLSLRESFPEPLRLQRRNGEMAYRRMLGYTGLQEG